MSTSALRTVEILLVEDSPTDVMMTREAFADTGLKNNLNVVENGVEAIAYLRKQGEFADVPRPDLIFLDFNLPKKNGREVLAEIKADPKLKFIPVIVLTTSKAEDDISNAYNLQANCYVIKPVDFTTFSKTMGSILNFWFSVVTLQPGNEYA